MIQITGPLVIHYIPPDLIITWHSPHSPEVYQSNLPLVSVIFTLFMIHHHLGTKPQFNATFPLTSNDLNDLSHDFLSMLHIDPSVTQHLPHIPIFYTGTLKTDIGTIDSIISSNNAISCSLNMLLSKCFPTWYTPQIPLSHHRKVSITHHAERTLHKTNGQYPVSLSCYSIDIDITPCHAATQRISTPTLSNSLPTRSSSHAIQKFLMTCPLHIYTAVLQHVLSSTKIDCEPPVNLNKILKPRRPQMYFLPRFGFYTNPDSSGLLTIHLILIHSHDMNLPSILSPGDSIHLRHSDPIFTHMHHFNESLKPLTWPEPTRVHSIIEQPFGKIYHYKFAPKHADIIAHDIYWPFDSPIADQHNID
jgi:hypothetical protein